LGLSKRIKALQWQTPLAATLNSKGYFREWQTRTIGSGLVARTRNGLIMGEYRISGDLLLAGDSLADIQNQEAKPSQ
jgi:hypothetical protein